MYRRAHAATHGSSTTRAEATPSSRRPKQPGRPVHIKKKKLEATSGVLVQNEQRLTRSAAGVGPSAAAGRARAATGNRRAPRARARGEGLRRGGRAVYRSVRPL